MPPTPFTTVVTSGAKLHVRQIKEWTEIITGFETKNRYGVYGDDGNELAYIAEESGVAGRFFLEQSRACTLHVYDRRMQEIARIDKPFSFYLHEMTVVEDGRVIGTVARHFTPLPIVLRYFVVRDTHGVKAADINGAIWHPWTFTVRASGRNVAVISKGWSGALQEMFTTADTFGLEFTARVSDDLKKLLLAATMLIDFCYFEDKD